MKRVLLLIPSRLKGGSDYEVAVASGQHPRMDYHALADTLAQEFGATDVDLLGFDRLDEDSRLRRLARTLGNDFALAAAGAARAQDYDAVFSNGENVAIPLALLWRAAGKQSRRRRPGHVSIGHRLSTPKKQAFFGPMLGADRGIDRIFVYATVQQQHAQHALGLSSDKAPLIAFHADTDFWKPQPEVAIVPNRIVSAGLEWRDYPTLLTAARQLPSFEFRLAAASPWSKHVNETERTQVPANVEARRYDYAGLRELYASAAVVAVPLYDNDFQAGVTTMLEAMAMGKAVVVTGTRGQGSDVIQDGVNGLCVAPGDAAAWKQTLERLVSDPARCQRLGDSARQWVQDNATLKTWTHKIASALEAVVRDIPQPSAADMTSPQAAISRR